MTLSNLWYGQSVFVLQKSWNLTSSNLFYCHSMFVTKLFVWETVVWNYIWELSWKDHNYYRSRWKAKLFVVAVQSLSPVWLFATLWTASRQASLSFTTSQSLLKLMSLESVMLSKHLILCHPLLLLPSVFPSIRVFSSESALRIRWPKY